VESATELLLGAWLAGICLGTVRMGLHHKLCHTLGGSFHPTDRRLGGKFSYNQ
jgi:alcohol dehydrogenase class IV